jgi:hypothetical protein
MCHICRTVGSLLDRVLTAALQTYSEGKTLAGYCLVSSNSGEYRDENCDCSGRNACRGDCRQRCRSPAQTARLSGGSSRQNADWQGPHREDPDRQGTRRVAILAGGFDSGLAKLTLSSTIEGRSVVNRPKRSGLCLLAGFTLAVLLQCEIQSASANEADTGAVSERFVSLIQEFQKRVVDANALVSSEAPVESKPAPQSTWKSGSAKGPYYVDFRARTAASWGHAFVWYGKTSERQVEVAGLTPAGDTLAYVVGYLTWVPSETGASYGDLDPEYLTAHYRVYLNEPDAKRVFAYIKELQASSPVWNAETSNCTSFIGSIASFMGLKVPHRWQRPEEYVNSLKAMNGGRQVVHLSSVP